MLLDEWMVVVDGVVHYACVSVWSCRCKGIDCLRLEIERWMDGRYPDRTAFEPKICDAQ